MGERDEGRVKREARKGETGRDHQGTYEELQSSSGGGLEGSRTRGRGNGGLRRRGRGKREYIFKKF